MISKSFKEKSMGILANIILNHYIKIIIISLVFVGVSIGLAIKIEIAGYTITKGLKVKTSIKDMLPESKKSQAYNDIIDDFDSASSVYLVIEGDEKKTVPFAHMIVRKIKEEKNLSQHIKFIKLDLDKEFFQKYGLLIAKNNQCDNSVTMFGNLPLLPFITGYNDNMEKTYTGKYKQESIDTNKKEMGVDKSLSSLELFIEQLIDYLKNPEALPIEQRAAYMADLMTVGETMQISRDRKMLLVMIQPSISMNDMEKATEFVLALEKFIKSHAAKSKGVDVKLGGFMAIQKDEYVYMMQDMQFPAYVAVALIIIMFMVSFRAPRVTIFVILALLISVCWTAGFIAISTGTLNMLSMMFGVILVGLGVDFGIHISTQYIEDRARGLVKKESLKNALLKVGYGVIVGAITTSLAFYTLSLVEAQAMNEFGIVLGTGILLCLISMMTFLPALLVLFDKKSLGVKKPKIYLQYSFLEKTGSLVKKYHWLIIIFCIIFTAGMVYLSTLNSFEYDMMEIEPQDADSIIANKDIIKKFDMSPDNVVIALADDTDADVQNLIYNKTKLSALEKARRIAKAVEPKINTIAFVDSLYGYVPSPERQAYNLKLLEKLRNQPDRAKNGLITLDNLPVLIRQLNRLEDNVLEMADMASLTFGDNSKIAKRRNRMIREIKAGGKPGKSGKELLQNLIKLINQDKEKTIQLLNRLSPVFAAEMNNRVDILASPTKILTVPDLPDYVKNRYLSKDGSKQICNIFIYKNVWDQHVLEKISEDFTKVQIRHLPAEEIGVNKFYESKAEADQAKSDLATGQDGNGSNNDSENIKNEPKDKQSLDTIKNDTKEDQATSNGSNKSEEDFDFDVDKVAKEQQALEKRINKEAKLLKKDDETHNFTGMPQIMLEMVEMFKEEGSNAVLLALLVIVLLVLIYTRSIKYTILTVIPLVFGAAWMTGLMYLFGIKFDYFNVMALPIILGIGVDDGIHLIHRFQIEGDDNADVVLKYTGRGILLTSLTNVFSFGTIAVLGAYKGLAGFGAVLSFGVIGCFLVSIFLLSSLVYAFRKKNISK